MQFCGKVKITSFFICILGPMLCARLACFQDDVPMGLIHIPMGVMRKGKARQWTQLGISTPSVFSFECVASANEHQQG